MSLLFWGHGVRRRNRLDEWRLGLLYLGSVVVDLRRGELRRILRSGLVLHLLHHLVHIVPRGAAIDVRRIHLLLKLRLIAAYRCARLGIKKRL